MEPTLMQSFIKRGIFLAALRSTPVPSEILNVAECITFHPDAGIEEHAADGTIFEPAAKKPIQDQILAPNLNDFRSTMPNDIYDALLVKLGSDRLQSSMPISPIFLHRGSICGESDRLLDPLWAEEGMYTDGDLTFATWTSAEDNSIVHVNVGQATIAAQIHRIFLHKRVVNDDGECILERFVAVRQYRSLTDDETNESVYSDFPDLTSSLCHNDFLDGHIIVRPQDMVCLCSAHRYKHERFGPVIAFLTASESNVFLF